MCLKLFLGTKKKIQPLSIRILPSSTPKFKPIHFPKRQFTTNSIMVLLFTLLDQQNFSVGGKEQLIFVFLGDHTGFEVLNKTMNVISPPQQDLEWPSSVHKFYHSMRSMFHDITRLQPPIPEKVKTMMSLMFLFCCLPKPQRTEFHHYHCVFHCPN